jgi:diguanylate cyclase (GGDEF)-like protein
MSSPGNEKPTLKDSLLRQGVSKQEIDKVYQTLRAKGYGEEEARRRSAEALERLRAQKEIEERRKAADARSRAARASGREAQKSAKPDAPEQGKEPGRRAVDWMPEVPGWLRRRINRYAFANGYLITRFSQRIDDFLSFFDPVRGDFSSPALLRLLSDQKGYRGQNPYRLSFIDDLDALRDSARRLLGGPKGAEVVRLLAARDPFIVEFLGAFTEGHEVLRTSLQYVGSALHGKVRLRVAELARVIKDGCRLAIRTGAVERDKLEKLYDVVREVNLTLEPGPRSAEELAEAEAVFRAAFQNLARYGHELYPGLLKMIGAFYDEDDVNPAKQAKIMEFIELRAEDLLSWEVWERKMREQRQKALEERQARELARLEQEKAEQFSTRFEGSLATLASLFPDSGIERVEQGEFVLPYFANRIFPRNPEFQSRLPDLELVHAGDVMGLLFVLHSILDDLLSSLEPYDLERLIGAEGIASDFVDLRESWREAYPRLFEPYLDSIREYARETDGDPRYAKQFRESQRARTLEERINQLRNRAVKGFGHMLSGRELYDGPKLFEQASRLAGLLAEAGKVINQATIAAEDPVRRKAAEELGVRGIVDLVSRSQTGGAGHRAVTRQIRRWIEARFRRPVEEIPQKAQVAFMEVFRGVGEIYDYLVNDPASFAARASHGVVVAGTDERAAWAHERGEHGRDPLLSLPSSLREEYPGQFTDVLTGLKNKDFFLTELPRRLDRLRAQKKPLTLIMIDIDHFKWVNDELGHPRGDEVLKLTAVMVLDNIREGDLAVRYGGEEMLVVVPSDLHTGIVLAERLRYAQEQQLTARESTADLRRVAAAGGEPCCTLSIGVADVTSILDLTKAVDRVDKALYAAKRTRNSVVFVDPGKEKRGGEAFTTYAEYRQRVRPPGALSPPGA